MDQPLDLSCPAKKPEPVAPPREQDDNCPEDLSASGSAANLAGNSNSESPASASRAEAASRNPVYLLHRFKRPRSSDSPSDSTSSGSPDEAAVEAVSRSSSQRGHGPARKRFLTKFRREDETGAGATTSPSSANPPESHQRDSLIPSRRHSDHPTGRTLAIYFAGCIVSSFLSYPHLSLKK